MTKEKEKNTRKIHPFYKSPEDVNIVEMYLMLSYPAKMHLKQDFEWYNKQIDDPGYLRHLKVDAIVEMFELHREEWLEMERDFIESEQECWRY